MKNLLPLILILAVVVVGAFGQEKNWLQWSKADAEKILNHSGWSQTQSDTDTSEMVYSPTSRGTSSIGDLRMEERPVISNRLITTAQIAVHQSADHRELSCSFAVG